MYIVVHTLKPDGKDECSSYESEWSAHETLEEAQKEYQFLLDCPQIYTASICGVIESTDYSPTENNKIGDLDRLNQDL